MKNKLLLIFGLVLLFSVYSSGQSKSNSFQIGWQRAWSENWKVSYGSFDLKYHKDINNQLGFYASLSNYFKSAHDDNNTVTIIYKNDTTVLKELLSISRTDTDKYPFISKSDYERLNKTGIIPLSPKVLRMQLYIFEIGGTYRTDLIFNHHQFGIQFGVNLTYSSIKDRGNREAIDLLIEELSDEKVKLFSYEYPLYFRNIDFSFGVGINYKYFFNERLYSGVDLNVHNGLFLTTWNDSLIPGYLGLGIVFGSKF